jgi:sulfur carrier protein
LRLIINGQPTEVPDTVQNIEQLLGHFGLQDKLLMIELDLKIIQSSEHKASLLAEGCKVEIVHFVGGG